MPPLSPTRDSALTHHLAEAGAWLAESDHGRRSTHLSYAGFELRLTLERLMVEYLIRVRGNQLKEEDLKLISSFKNAQNRIYELEGHQGKIDRKFRIFEILFEMMEIPVPIAKPNLGTLAGYWHKCSEFCHVTWTFSSASMDATLLDEAFGLLSGIHEYLTKYTQQLITWPVFQDPKAGELEKSFIAGEADDNDVRAYFRQTGIWARVERPEGNQFVGKAIPPGGEVK